MPNTRPYLRAVFAVALLGVGLFTTESASATPNGIQGFSGASGSTCTACHGGGTAPSVTLSADSGSTMVTPGSTTGYTFMMSGGPASVGGLDIAASGGTLIDTNASGTQISNGGELIQSSPNPINGGSKSWTFNWQAPMTPGTYTVYAAGLSANGNGGTSGDGTGSTSLQITVASATNQPPVAVINAPTSGMENTVITFDGSNSSDPDGSISSYDWNFGDGANGTGAQVTHAFAAGTYTVELTVTDNMGAMNTASMTIQIAATNVPPVANISGPSNGTEGVPVTFDGSGSTDSDGNIVAYDWDFGDNTAGSGATVTHTFTAGTYTVTLMVTDNDGAFDHATLEVSIATATEPQPPVANAGGPYNATVGEAVQFDGSSSMDPDGTISAYSWDFGDGNTSTGVGPIHTYNAPGTYTVVLTVTDNDGLQGSSQTSAEIISDTTPPPPPPPDNTTEAQVLYDTYCASCHGEKGTAGFDPELQGEDAEDINEAIDEVPEMGFLADVLSQADIDAIAGYLSDGSQDKPDDGDHDDHNGDGDGDHDGHNGDGDGDHDSDEDHSGDNGKESNKSSDGRDRSANPFVIAETTGGTPGTGGGALDWLFLLTAVFVVVLRRYLRT